MPNRRTAPAIAALAAVLLAVPVPGTAQEAPTNAPTDAPDPAVAPGAVDALQRMGVYLTTLRAFEVRAAVSINEASKAGQKVQLGDEILLRVRRPQHLWAEMSSASRTRQYFFDGESFTIYDPRHKSYTTAAAPATLNDAVARLEERYGLAIPLIDLFRWSNPSRAKALQKAAYVGAAKVGETTCDHLAFREAGLDWQIWIKRGESPLPLKLVATGTGDNAKPQYAVAYDWNLTPSLKDAVFTFTPPADAHQVTLQELNAGPAAEN
jgi:hypothetical protein